MAFWLMKCEPSAYSINDLSKEKTTSWEGVRNYQARNFMRDDMKIGDMAIFYHSNANPSGAAGVMKISRASYPDSFALKAGHKYHDPKSTPEKPIWYMVDVEFVARFAEVVPLSAIKAEPELDGIMVAKKGSRLSIQPLSEEHFLKICRMGGHRLENMEDQT